MAQRKPIKAREILGSALDPAAQVSQTVLTVKQLLAPLSREQIGLVRCLGLNYADHAVRPARFIYPPCLLTAFTHRKRRICPRPSTFALRFPPSRAAHVCSAPVLFIKPVSTVTGPGAPIVIPKVAQPVEKHLPDYEVELTIVIGKPAKNVSEEDALDYVLGYTCANDVRMATVWLVAHAQLCFAQVSFRFHQMNVSQWGFSKGFGARCHRMPCAMFLTKRQTIRTLLGLA
jgi:hypothetical protein